jgi:hypothetical protein
MPNKRAQRNGRGVQIVLAAATLIALSYVGWLLLSGGKEKPQILREIVPRFDAATSAPLSPETEKGAKHLSAPPVPETTPHAPPVAKDRMIVYETLKKDKQAAALQETRKARYGLRESVDMIVRPEESISIGGTIVPMQEILDAVRIMEGKLIEKNLIPGRVPFNDESPGVKRFPIDIDRGGGETSDYGIYVVQRGDNVWNIHFKLLKEHFAARGIKLPPTADKPDPRGTSSGIGRILKFSEKEVYIYNFFERRLSADIDLIYPLSKIVVYNMRRITSILDQIDPRQLGSLRFDGTTLWFTIQGN